MERLRDLPVAVELPGQLGQEVTAFVEVEAGWQVVTSAGPPRPVLVLASGVRPGVATVVVLEGSPAPARVRTELLAGALDVIGWPADRDRLRDAPLRIRHLAPAGPRPRTVGIAGVAGGVGTSTVALAVAGMLAWSGRRVIVAGADDLLRLTGLPRWTGPGTPELAALGPGDAGREIAGIIRPVAGVPGLSVIGGGGRSVTSTAGWPADVVVLDAGCHADRTNADLLVARPDAALRAAAESGPVRDVPTVLVGEAPLGRAAARRLVAGGPVATVPHAARVARAALAGRVPSGLPGSWLAALRPAVRAVTA